MGRHLVARRQPQGVRVVPLTRELATRLKAQAAVALNGDGSCSLRAMTTSCFASENCAAGHSALHLDMLATQPHAFVALSDLAPDGAPLEEDAFVGCVTAAPASGSGLCARLFPARTFGATTLLLSNLCVADAYRKQQVGRRLVDKIVALDPGCHLLVARTVNPDPQVQAAFAARVERLRATYAKLGFVVVDECPEAILMRRQGA
jgi:GNAT superfamily N-acetyltransferase